MTVLITHSTMSSVMSVKFVQRQQVHEQLNTMGWEEQDSDENTDEGTGIQVRDVLCVCFLQDVAGRRPGDSSSMRSCEEVDAGARYGCSETRSAGS